MLQMVANIVAKRDNDHLPVVVTEDDTHIDDAIGISFTNRKRHFYTRCKVTAYFGSHTAYLPTGYHWNGADIPRFCWTLLGISPMDQRSIIASGFHDRGTEDKKTQQVIADATFVCLLRPFRFNGVRQQGVGRFRAVLMYMAVRFYSVFCRPLSNWWRGKA